MEFESDAGGRAAEEGMEWAEESDAEELRDGVEGGGKDAKSSRSGQHRNCSLNERLTRNARQTPAQLQALDAMRELRVHR